jgi:hypothetical protein
VYVEYWSAGRDVELHLIERDHGASMISFRWARVGRYFLLRMRVDFHKFDLFQKFSITLSYFENIQNLTLFSSVFPWGVTLFSAAFFEAALNFCKRGRGLTICDLNSLSKSASLLNFNSLRKGTTLLKYLNSRGLPRPLHLLLTT